MHGLEGPRPPLEEIVNVHKNGPLPEQRQSACNKPPENKPQLSLAAPMMRSPASSSAQRPPGASELDSSSMSSGVQDSPPSSPVLLLGSQCSVDTGSRTTPTPAEEEPSSTASPSAARAAALSAEPRELCPLFGTPATAVESAPEAQSPAGRAGARGASGHGAEEAPDPCRCGSVLVLEMENLRAENEQLRCRAAASEAEVERLRGRAAAAEAENAQLRGRTEQLQGRASNAEAENELLRRRPASGGAAGPSGPGQGGAPSTASASAAAEPAAAAAAEPAPAAAPEPATAAAPEPAPAAAQEPAAAAAAQEPAKAAAAEPAAAAAAEPAPAAAAEPATTAAPEPAPAAAAESAAAAAAEPATASGDEEPPSEGRNSMSREQKRLLFWSGWKGKDGGDKSRPFETFEHRTRGPRRPQRPTGEAGADAGRDGAKGTASKPPELDKAKRRKEAKEPEPEPEPEKAKRIKKEAEPEPEPKLAELGLRLGPLACSTLRYEKARGKRRASDPEGGGRHEDRGSDESGTETEDEADAYPPHGSAPTTPWRRVGAWGQPPPSDTSKVHIRSARLPHDCAWGRPPYARPMQIKQLIAEATELAKVDYGVVNKYTPFSKTTYGEVLSPFVRIIIKELKLTKDDVFLDIGCGWGNVVFEVAAMVGCRAVGIEIREDLHQISVDVLPHFNRLMAEHNIQAGQCEFSCADAEQASFAGYTKIFMNNVLFPEETSQNLQRSFKESLAPGVMLLTLRHLDTKYRPSSRVYADSPLRIFRWPFRHVRSRARGDVVSWAATDMDGFLYVVDGESKRLSAGSAAGEQAAV
eukprot:tig00020951_g16466.t1